MEQDSGILRKSSLSLRKEPFPTVEPDFITAYKHYIFTFYQNRTSDGGNCVVFDTQKGTTTTLNSGLNMEGRMGYTFCYWKDNIFVLYGGTSSQQEKGLDVHFVSVIENDGQISFTTESCNFTDEKWWGQGDSAHIYQDVMYILPSKARNSPRYFEIVKKFDLNERKWIHCPTTGEVPKPCKDSTAALFNGKIYFAGCFQTERSLGSGPIGTPLGGGGRSLGSGPIGTPLGGGGGGLFGARPNQLQSALDFYVLDLESMRWKQTRRNDILPKPVQYNFHAEVVGDKIYFANQNLDEFFIYDPANNNLLKSEGLPPKENWRIRSFKNHSIIFRMYYQSSGQFCIKYQDFAHPEQEEEKVTSVDPLVATSQQLPYMEHLWKEKPFADVTFIIENEEIQAHRVILLKCRYFQNMFKSGMIEANSNKINVSDIPSMNFKAILEYIYCDKIALQESLAMELVILADMYMLPNLKADCEKYLSEKLTVMNFVQVMKVAQTADSEKLEKRVVNFLTSNIEKVKQEVDIHAIPPELFVRAIIDLKSTKK